MGKDTFAILLDSTEPVYYPGQTVSGRIQLNLADDMKVRGIKLRFHGYADVEWKEEHKSGNTKRIIYYRSSETYVDQQLDVYGKVQTGQDSTVLKPGNYTYPFSCQLPPDCPSSYEAHIGRVRYYIQATVDRPWAFDKHARTMFTVISILDLNHVTMSGNLNEGGEFTNTKTLCCLCCKSPPITGTMKVLHRRGFVPGESILFNAEVDNQSKRTMKNSKVQLFMRVTYYAGGKTRTVNNVVHESIHGEIEGGATDVWTNEKLFIPAVPPSFLTGCNIIDIRYFATLVVYPSGPAFDLLVPVEIVIGSIPLINVAQQHGITLPALPTPQADGLYSDPVMPPNLPSAMFAQSAMGQANNEKATDGEDNSSGGNFAPVYTYYNWERRDPASNFTVQMNEN